MRFMKPIALLFGLILSMPVSCANTAQAGGSAPDSDAGPRFVEWSQEAFDDVRPGDEIVVRNGTYRDLAVRIDVEATAEAPVVIRSETPGGVVLTGSSSLSIGGSHIVVSGLHFRDCDVAEGNAVFNFRVSPKRHAVRSRLDNCLFSGSGQEETLGKDIKWVSLYGHDNEVSHCSFVDKKILGSLLVVWIDPQVVPAHRIHDCFFTHPFSLRENGSSVNGQEMIRIGTSAVSMSEVRCEVYDNYFYRCDGEVEIISNKSCGNIYRNNVFDSCQGTLTLRHGNGCTVDGNYFFGRGVANTGGVRIIGERHRVFNNYFEELAGRDQRSAISLVRGVENSELYEYFQVRDAQVVFNTIVNCRSGIMANTGSSTSTMPVVESLVAANLIVGNASGAMQGVTVVADPAPDIRWEGNHVYGVTVTGDTDGGVATAPGFDLERRGATYVLRGESAGNYDKVSGFGYVATDITGAQRPDAKTPGAHEPAAENPTRTMPTRESAGITWQSL